MSDITMCPGDLCPIKGNCYRYTAVPSNVQSYLLTAPYEARLEPPSEGPAEASRE